MGEERAAEGLGLVRVHHALGLGIEQELDVFAPELADFL
jgi:hypothetical protein